LQDGISTEWVKLKSELSELNLTSPGLWSYDCSNGEDVRNMVGSTGTMTQIDDERVEEANCTPTFSGNYEKEKEENSKDGRKKEREREEKQKGQFMSGHVRSGQVRSGRVAYH
jgi:hypothetical protein